LMRPILAIALCLVLVACDRGDVALSAAKRVQATVGEVDVVFSVSAIEISPTDRTTLTVSAVFPAGTSYEPDPEFAADLGAEGWTVVAQRSTPLRRTDDGRLTVSSEIVLEPFLPGEYRIIPPRIGTGVLPIEPIPVTVSTLLAEDDALAADPELADLRTTPVPTESGGHAWIYAVVGGIVVVGIGLAVAMRRAKPRPDIDAAALRRASKDARRIADLDEPSRADIDTLDAAVRAAGRINDPDEDLVSELEAARFGPSLPAVSVRRDLAERGFEFVRTSQQMFPVEHREREGAHG